MQANLQVIELLQVILQEVERYGARGVSGSADGTAMDAQRRSLADCQACH